MLNSLLEATRAVARRPSEERCYHGATHILFVAHRDALARRMALGVRDGLAQRPSTTFPETIAIFSQARVVEGSAALESLLELASLLATQLRRVFGIPPASTARLFTYAQWAKGLFSERAMEPSSPEDR
jgi:hypothetical protein